MDPKLFRSYQDTFAVFSAASRRVQSMVERPAADAVDLQNALLELERARMAWSQCRNALAEEMLFNEGRTTAAVAMEEPLTVREDRVRGIAELLWEGAGRPAGSATEDWFRAERIVRDADEVAQAAGCAC